MLIIHNKQVSSDRNELFSNLIPEKVHERILQQRATSPLAFVSLVFIAVDFLVEVF